MVRGSGVCSSREHPLSFGRVVKLRPIVRSGELVTGKTHHVLLTPSKFQPPGTPEHLLTIGEVKVRGSLPGDNGFKTEFKEFMEGMV